MLAPGSIIGILGGGQLGRMTAMAAARLGYRCHIYTDDADGPGAQVTSLVTVGDLADTESLGRFARNIDIASYETENIPLAAIDTVLQHAPVAPGRNILSIAQDRLREKDWLTAAGIATTPYRRVESAAELASAMAALRSLSASGRAVLKTARFGYDGKGQLPISAATEPHEAWSRLGGGCAILEAFVAYRCEVSVIVARGVDGSVAAFPVGQNHHEDHILATTTVPAQIGPELVREAERMAVEIAERLDLVGLLAVEMFITTDGRVLVNELAPRPHNSGHWTMDACETSQFEQLVRALAGLPLGPTGVTGGAVMRNLIGDEVLGWHDHLGDPSARLHLYGKREVKPGRKMGHVTRVIGIA